MDIDARQIQAYRQMTPAQRVRAGCSLHDFAHRRIMHMLARQHPDKTRRELQILAARRFLGESAAVL